MKLKHNLIKIFSFIFALLMFSPVTYSASKKRKKAPLVKAQSSHQQQNEKIEIDCAFSIGSYCVVGRHLEHHNLRFQACPLDWLGPISSKDTEYTLDTVIHLFQTKFIDLLSEIFVTDRTCGECKVVLDTKNRIESRHYVNKNAPLDEEIERVREIICRRGEKVDKILKDSNSIALVSRRDNSKEEFIDFIKKFSKIYPNKKIYLINVKYVESKDISSQVLYNKENLKVIEYYFERGIESNYKNGRWAGFNLKHKGWNTVMENIKLTGKINRDTYENTYH